MSVESYVVKGTMALDLAPTLAGLREMAAGFKGILEQMTALRDMQRQINSSMAIGGKAFASQLSEAAKSAESVANAAERVARASQNFQLQGQPYIPGSALVATGIPGSQQSESARGPAGYAPAGAGAGNYAVVPYAQPYGGVAYRGGTIPPGGVPGAGDEPFYQPGSRPVDLYNPTGARPGYSDYMMAGYGVRAAGNAASGLVDSSFMAAAGADQLKQALLTQGFTKEQSEQAFAAAVKTQQDVMGTYVGKNLGLVVQLMALTQDANTSIAMLPEMARAQQVFTGLGRNGDAEISAAMKSAELRGVLFENGKANLPAIAHFLKNMEAVASMSGGRYGPGDILQLLKSGGIAAGIMSDENGLAEMLPFIQSMGAARAGTALRAFGREFPGGRMNDAAFNTLVDMGLISHPELSQKVGLGYHQLLPGAMGQGDFDQATFHPESFIMDRLLPLAQAYDARKYGDSYNKGNDKERLAIETVTMGQIASMIPGGVYMAETLRLVPLVSRDVTAFKNQAAGDAYKTSVEENPMMRMAALNAAIDAFKITLGNDNMAVSIATMKALTAALNGMVGVFTADPALGTQMMLVADAMKVLAPALTALMVVVPAVQALSKIAKWAAPAGLAAGEGGLAGIAAPAAIAGASAWSVKSLLDAGAQWEDKFLNEHFGSIPRDISQPFLTDKAHGMSDKDLSAKYHIHVHNYLDGKEIGGHMVQSIVKGANGPSTGSNDFDARRGYTPTEQ